MTVIGKPLPPEHSILAAIDTEARATVARARAEIVPIVAHETPRRTGRAAAALRPRQSRTATGHALTVAPSRGREHGNVTVAQVVRWVNRGTGLYRDGPGDKRRIRSSRRPARPMVLPGGRRYWTVAGQRPNPFMARIRVAGNQRMQRAARDGAARTTIAVGRTLAR